MTQGEMLYTEGRLAEAWEALQREAREGSGRAMYCIGQYYLFGLGESGEKPAEAAAWFRRGAPSDPMARVMEALFLRPEAVDREALTEAVSAVEKDAEAGSAEALFCLFALYSTGVKDVIEADVPRAQLCCARAADAGFWQAEMELGLRLLNGQSIPKNAEKGAMYLKRAADKGIGKAEYHLAYCCLAGEGTEKNPSLAVAYYQKALRHGYLHAAVELGVYYEMGVHVKQDRKKACQLYKRAADRGDAEGRAHYADCLLAGDVVKRNPRQAAALYQEAAKSGSAYALVRLGETAFNSGDDGTAFRYFMEAAQMGMPAAQYLTGLCLLQGRGVSADRRAAAVWLRKAAQNGSREAGQLLMQFGL